MKTPKMNASLRTCSPSLAATATLVLALATLAHAADDTWTGATDGNWSVNTNWVTAAPGATTGTVNADTATFNTNPTNKIITIDANRNIRNITFDTASVGGYTIGSAGANGGETLKLSSGGKILITGTVANGITQTFNAPISLNGAYTIDNQSTGSANFVFAGDITAASNSLLVINTTTTGTGVNVFSGALKNGTGTLSISIGQFSSGIGNGKVEFTGANTYSGNTNIAFVGGAVGVGEFIASGTNSSAGTTTVTHGTLTLNNASNGGLASGQLELGGGGHLRANTAAAGVLSNNVRHSNTFTITGANDLTFNGNFTNNTASNRPLNNTLASGKKLTFNGDVYLSTVTGTGRVWQLRGSGETIINGDVMDFSGGKGTAASGIDFNTSAGGARSLTLAGTNTYSGNTLLGGGASTIFNLADTGSMMFYIGANGVNNQITGSATANFNGAFVFDLSGAALVDGNSWTIVDVGTVIESFSSTFSVSGFSDVDADNIWTNGAGLSFNETTGVLSYAAVPEPSSIALLGGLGALAVVGLRRRRSRVS